MNETYKLWQALKAYGDVMILMCLFLGGMARLCRNESLTVWNAAKEFYFSIIIGAVTTGFFLWLTELPMIAAWWLALGVPIGSSMVVEIAYKRATDIRDMSLAETVTFIFDEVQRRFKKVPTPNS